MKLKPNPLVQKLNRQNDIGENRTGYIRLDKNERTVSFSKKIFNDIIKSISLEELSAYADQSKLYKKLEVETKLDKKFLLLTPGSDSAIKFIFETFVIKKDVVGYLWPTYAMIDVYSELYGAKKYQILYNENLKIDYNQIDDFLRKKPKILFIANPNQPTGTIIKASIIEKIIKVSK